MIPPSKKEILSNALESIVYGTRKALLGHVVNVLGVPIDGKGVLNTTE